MKLGIVGSSYSVGRHYNYNTQQANLALPFETWFEGIDVINSACAGKGTELYLNKIVYLKQRHNIDTLLLEVVNNRSMLNFHTEMEMYEIIREQKNIQNIVNDVYKDNASMLKYKRFLQQNINYEKFGTKSEFEAWRRFQEVLAREYIAMEFWALCDIRQAIDLCCMLGIKVVAWAHHWYMEEITAWKSVIKDAVYVKFPGYPNAFKYYVAKYGEDETLCDDCHFNDKTNKEMVEDFIIPALNTVQN